MALPLLATLGSFGASALSQTGKSKNGPDLPPAGKANNGKQGGELPEVSANFLKDPKNKDNLQGKNNKEGLVQGFKDFFSGNSNSNLKNTLLEGMKDQMKSALGMDDNAYSAFSTLFKGGKFSDIPMDQLLAAGKFIFDQASKL